MNNFGGGFWQKVRSVIASHCFKVSRSNTWWLRGKHSGRHWGSRETKGNLSTRKNVKLSRTPTKKKCLSKINFAWKFCFFLMKKTWFQTKNFYFCMTNTPRRTQNMNLWFQPENSHFEVCDHDSRTSWHAQWLSCCKNTSGWHCGTKNVWCLSSLKFEFHKLQMCLLIWLPSKVQ